LLLLLLLVVVMVFGIQTAGAASGTARWLD
jgi:hypothetical protein